MSADVSRETALQDYLTLLQKWSRKINLVAETDDKSAWTRHIEDSLQIAPHVSRTDELIADLGSGGGLPAVPLAIALPDRRIVAIEADQRKAEFLRTVRRSLALDNLEVLADRAEKLPPQSADIVTARGFAPLPRLLEHAARHMRPGARALLLKGRTVEAEIAEARKDWLFDHELHPSRTAHDARILEIHELRHA